MGSNLGLLTIQAFEKLGELVKLIIDQGHIWFVLAK